jgi:hypothetical protein
MTYLGGLSGDEREMFQTLLAHFVDKLNEERLRTAELSRQMDIANERLALLEAAAYGMF